MDFDPIIDWNLIIEFICDKIDRLRIRAQRRYILYSEALLFCNVYV